MCVYACVHVMYALYIAIDIINQLPARNVRRLAVPCGPRKYIYMHNKCNDVHANVKHYIYDVKSFDSSHLTSDSAPPTRAQSDARSAQAFAQSCLEGCQLPARFAACARDRPTHANAFYGKLGFPLHSHNNIS